MTSCLYYPTISASMPFQMALDEILFNRAVDDHLNGRPETPLLRFYYTPEPWISLGYAYAGWKDPDAGPAAGQAAPGVPVCRRITGGGQVLHGRDLMFTLIGPKGLETSFKSVRVSYLKIHEVVKSALESLGYRPRFYRCDEDLPRGRDCFLFPIATDLEVNGKKIAGGGQKRSLGMFMHQESVQLLKKDEGEALERALKEEFAKALGLRFEKADLRPEWLDQAEKLGSEKYRAASLQGDADAVQSTAGRQNHGRS